MPQFDKLAFFNQIFWLLILFFFFYFLIIFFFLPKISAVLKIRQKVLKTSFNGVFDYQKEKTLILENLFKKCSFFFNQKYVSVFLVFLSNSLAFLKETVFSLKQNFKSSIFSLDIFFSKKNLSYSFFNQILRNISL